MDNLEYVLLDYVFFHLKNADDLHFALSQVRFILCALDTGISAVVAGADLF